MIFFREITYRFDIISLTLKQFSMNSFEALKLLAMLCILQIVLAIPMVSAEPLTYESLSTRAQTNSYDLLIGRIDTSASRNKVREARIAYLPTVTANLNTEYVGGFGNANNPQNANPVVVGSVILPGNTRFQNASSLNLSYTALDFGNRSNQLSAAKKHVQGLIYQQKSDIRDLKLSMLDAYLDALLTYKEINSKQEQLKLQTQLYELNMRLWHAGKISRIELGEQAISKSNTERELQELRRRMGELLNKLSSFTHDHYNVDNVELADFEPVNSSLGAPFFPNPSLPDFKAYEMLIQEKQAEIRAIRAQRYPQISVFGSFVLYGSNKSSWFGSLGDLSARQFYGGIATTVPIFDAFKTRVAVDGKKLEIQRLEAQRDKRIWDLRKDYDKAATAASLYKVEMKTSAQLLTHSEEQLSMVIRLTENQVLAKSRAVSEQIDLLSRKLHAEKLNLQRIAAAKRLKIYLEV